MATTVITSISKIEQDFNKKLRTFIEDKELPKAYANYTPIGDEVMIKLFKFIPSEQKKKKSSILMPGGISGDFKEHTAAAHEKILPIAKILRIGLGVKRELKAGDICTVAPDDIMGKDWNPDFIHLMNSFVKEEGKQGKLANVPKGMPQEIPKLEKNWARYRFIRPDRS